MSQLIWFVLLVGVVIVSLWLLRRGGRSTDLLLQTVDAFRLGDGLEGEALFVRLKETLRGTRDRMRAAEKLHHARAYEHALELVETVLALRPGHKRALRLRVLLLARLLRPDAVNLLRGWVKDNPRDGDAQLALAELFLKLRRSEEAVALLGPFVGQHPRDLRARSLLGRVLFHAGHLERAREHLLAAQALRDLQRRSVVTMYDNGQETGYDFRVAAASQWEEEEDKLLLEQIRERRALASVAVGEEEQAQPEPQVVLDAAKPQSL
jgi:tetratricopeptide (TPR) repeat protein